MANCGPCLKLGLQLMAHYPANKDKGKDAECYYHHFGMPLPATIQAKIAQPKPAAHIEKAGPQNIQQAQTDRNDLDHEEERLPDEVSKDSDRENKTDLRTKGEHPRSTGSRAGLTPDVCEQCWHEGHACPAHCTVDKQRLCIDCADGKPCAIVRHKSANPRTPAHERYHVKLPGVKKPRAADVALVSDDRGIVARVERTVAPTSTPKSTNKVNMSLVLDSKQLPTLAISTPIPTIASSTNHQQEKKETISMPEPKAPASTDKEKTPSSGTATIIVTDKHMDAFWAKLSLPEKAAIFQRQLEGA